MLKAGDLVRHNDYHDWGLGIVISKGPVWPISGESVTVMWPENPDEELFGLVEHYPILSLTKAG
jgi:hypothetical protein